MQITGIIYIFVKAAPVTATRRPLYSAILEGAMDFTLVKNLLINNNQKVILLILDGLGGLPQKAGGKTELETAVTPHLDSLAQIGRAHV